ncbi:S-adenosyl-L-methionine-dependent methyltransferase [Pyronema domesticum]|uniref:Similar to Putative tRNA (Cytosine-5-)-methyltransferase C23C4.17 acc. no. O13935 n=1 Tax=Pyronema omphalodes (strain CBS 100304) TaxID=1076935 RepID=U4LEF7_PYROM|nr:S-adenosyl-L-methionine-dependent methyltransferase [Pyronema domesticum]CCX29922.1 Similar to Putative tRNA (cytosine-5-)-methyltransferase C23C4.17; acc. no. O13935 [Pyronema omphalodes CBS 100304]
MPRGAMKKKGGKGGFNRNKNGGPKRDRDAHRPGVRGSYDTIVSENALYEKYYKEAKVVPEEEWDDFWSALKRTLPTTFRFTGSRGHALNTLKALRDIHVPHLQGIEWDGQMVDPPKPLAFYPDDLAWGLSVGKTTIRRCPPFKKFQNYLVAETTVGNISRQEAVSMIPPLLMDIEPHHVVLDMCAAPGSKTAQLVEMIHNGEETRVAASSIGPAAENLTIEGETGGRPTGLVIANDADYKRSHMLIHQTKRLNSPNLIVTNHDATMYPSLLISKPDEPNKQYLKFDRILADVPCTGDGTARKNYSVWKDWNPQNAFNLHNIQVRILVRGLQMLKTGGRLVYSTCSMNAIENEAVVQAAIDRCGGLSKVNIVDVSDKLPNLKRSAGLKGGWKVMDKDQTWYNTFEEVLLKEEGKDRVTRITKSMFPTETDKADDDETRIPLERCVRVYPHQQDTGGFFITVLEKLDEIRHIKAEEPRRIPDTQKQQAASVTETPSEATPAVQLDIETAKTTPPASPRKRGLESDSPAPDAKKLKADAEVLPEAPEVAETTETTEDAEAAAVSDVVTGTDKVTADPSDPSIITPIAAPASTEAPKPFDFRHKDGKDKKGPPPEEPFKYLPNDHEVLKRIYEFYGLSERFPRTCFMVRNAEGLPVRAIYFTSHLAKTILECNEGRGVKFVHCGVKAFMKQDVQSPEVLPWRIQSEGLSIVAPWIGDARVIHASKKDTVHALLKELFPKVGTTDAEKIKLEIEGYNSIGEIDEQVKAIGMGSCVLKVRKAEGEFDEDMILPLWKSRHSCNLMLPKDERKAMLLRLFDDAVAEVRDSTQRNSHIHRDAVAEGAEEDAEGDEETGDVEVKEDEVMQEA